MKLSLNVSQLLLLAGFCSTSVAQFTQCAHHPATKDMDGFQPVLLQKWDQPSSDGGSVSRAGYAVDYLPRAEAVWYAQTATDASNTTTLKGLDLIVKEDEPDIMLYRDNTPTFTFHRPATVFMLVTADKDLAEGKQPTYPEWNSVGWFHRQGTSLTADIGIRMIRTIPLDETVYVFSKQTDAKNSIALPSWEFVYRKSEHLVNKRQRLNQVIWLAGEEDGSPSSVPHVPNGVPAIVPGQNCPKELHDLWKLPANSSSSFPDFATDPDLEGQFFATWHPVFDPCYWCGYDHEHGSDASSLIGPEFAPHYTYTAWKNHRQDESVPGFKSFVFRYKKYMVVYDIHVQTSQPRRFQTAIHTGTFTMVDVKTDPSKPKLVLKLTRKLDFGPLEFMINDDADFLPVNATASALFAEENRQKFRRVRRVNSNVTNEYEQWDTKPMCALNTGRSTMFRVRITNTPTALSNFTEGQDPSLFTGIPLYRPIRGFTKTRQVGMRRQLVLLNVELGIDHCAVEIDGFVAARANNTNGVFYTDPMGAVAYTEPAKDRMWQFIAPEFKSFKFEDRVHVKMDSQQDTLYTTNDFNFPDNVPTADALDPEVN